MDYGLKGKVAVITGSGRGIGAATAAVLAAEGATIVVADLTADAARQTADALTRAGHSAIGIAVDVADEDSVSKMVDECLEKLGRIDILVNNAGFTRDARLERMSLADWTAIMDVVLKGAFLCTRAVIRHMTGTGGRIINIASRAYLGTAGQANYSAAKAGLIGFTKSQALEQGRFGITVNAVAPGFIDSPLTDQMKNADEIRKRALSRTPLPRLGTMSDVADAVAFLASERASWITGEVIHVTGGRFSD